MNYTTEDCQSIPLIPVNKTSLVKFLEAQNQTVTNWVHTNKFKAKPHDYCVVPTQSGEIQAVLFGIHENTDSQDAATIWSISDLAKKLPVEIYHIDTSHLDTDWNDDEQTLAAIGWGLGAYRFDFFKKDFLEPKLSAKLKVNEKHLAEINAFVDAFTLVRDLVNTPANHMMPEDLSQLAQELSLQHNAIFSEIIGDDLLEQNFPAIHAVGRASDHAPRLLQLNWNMDDNQPL
ncbi:MAG TPA: hypothetical protein EYH20_08090, partial [Leucothrix sp.]|nr:hypothetical protein [Leucothrix sp.]